MTDVNTWPTTAELPSTEHTDSVSDSAALAQPEINKALVAQRKMATIMNASNLSDGDILAFNAGTRRFEPSRTSNIQRYRDHGLPTAAQLRYDPGGAPYHVRRAVTPDFRHGSTQRYRFRSGPPIATGVTSITTSVANTAGHYVEMGLPTNFGGGNILTILLQNVTDFDGNSAGSNAVPVRVNWNNAFHFQASPGFSFVSGKIHDIPNNQTWQFKLLKITDSTILVTREVVYFSLVL